MTDSSESKPEKIYDKVIQIPYLDYYAITMKAWFNETKIFTDYILQHLDKYNMNPFKLVENGLVKLCSYINPKYLDKIKEKLQKPIIDPSENTSNKETTSDNNCNTTNCKVIPTEIEDHRFYPFDLIFYILSLKDVKHPVSFVQPDSKWYSHYINMNILMIASYTLLFFSCSYLKNYEIATKLIISALIGAIIQGNDGIVDKVTGVPIKWKDINIENDKEQNGTWKGCQKQINLFNDQREASYIMGGINGVLCTALMIGLEKNGYDFLKIAPQLMNNIYGQSAIFTISFVISSVFAALFMCAIEETGHIWTDRITGKKTHESTSHCCR